MVQSTRRVSAYQYVALMKEHLGARLGSQPFTPFSGEVILPRQLELHLGRLRGNACNLRCGHCQGQDLRRAVSPSITRISRIVEKLEGSIPLIVLSGNYSEPTLYPRLIELIERIKRTGANFGLHTNGVLLAHLERRDGFLSRMHAASTADDYVTVSLDAGRHQSFARTKRVSGGKFYAILNALSLLQRLKISTRHDGLKVRITYLLNKFNSSEAELSEAVALATSLGAASLRFSIPYAPYGTPMDACLVYHNAYEDPLYRRVAPVVRHVISSHGEKPVQTETLLMPPESQDIRKMTFGHCFHGYFQLTLGTDGYFYRCSAAASPDFPGLRLAPFSTSMNRFRATVLRNQNADFNPQVSCFPHGVRCNRAALEINRDFEAFYFPKKGRR